MRATWEEAYTVRGVCFCNDCELFNDKSTIIGGNLFNLSVIVANVWKFDA